MFDLFAKFFTAFHPPDTGDEKMLKAWRNMVAWTLMGNTLLWIALITAISVGLPVAGRIVWATDVKSEVEVQVRNATERILLVSAKVDGVEKTVSEMSSQLNDSLAQAKAAEIRNVALKRCTASNSFERDYHTREIDRLQNEYRRLMKERYEIPGCTQL